jgi:flavin-binding protein dodecin
MIAGHRDPSSGAVKQSRRSVMAKSKKSAVDAVYKVVEVIGTSPKSWEEAAASAVARAAETLRDLRIAEVVKQDMKVENGKVVAYRTRVLLSFKYEG